MKTGIFMTSVLLMLAQLVNAQCQANAGGNKHLCMDLYTTTAAIGGTPTASGGTSPYTYCWSTDAMPIFPGSTFSITASDLLNDTTLSNPALMLNNLVLPSTTFYLKVTDALGCVSYDTCKVTFTRFTYGLGNVSVYIDETMINTSDSIGINLMTVGGSVYTPCSYSWQPAYGLGTTSLAVGFQALPAVSTVYSVTVRDDKGCLSKPTAVYYVFVCPTGQVTGPFGMSCVSVGLKENPAKELNWSVYPNPVSNRLTVELPPGDAYRMKLSNVLGSACEEISLAGEKTELSLSRLNPGIYFLQVFENGNLVAAKKVIKE